MKKLLQFVMAAMLSFAAHAAAPIQPADVQIRTDPAVSVNVIRNKTNTGRIISVIVNQQDSVTVTKLPPPMVMHGGLPVDASSFPAPYLGKGTDLLYQAEVATASGDGSGDFRTVCLRSHFAFDDPIVFPGKPGASHAHVFFGNTGTNAFTTPDTLTTTGNSTCRGGTINRTAYWAPAILDTATNKVIDPQSVIAYYKTGYLLPDSTHPLFQPPPVGLKMIAGNSGATTEQTGGPASFVCINIASGVGPRTYYLPTACPAGDQIWQSVGFPQCWDGKNLDSPDHKSHMAYPTQNQQPPFGWSCDPAHPVILPEITINVLYIVPPTGTATWRLASDMYDAKLPAGYSLHSDWMMGWKPDIALTWTVNCIRNSANCQAHLLGDGRAMQEFDGN